VCCKRRVARDSATSQAQRCTGVGHIASAFTSQAQSCTGFGHITSAEVHRTRLHRKCRGSRQSATSQVQRGARDSATSQVQPHRNEQIVTHPHPAAWHESICELPIETDAVHQLDVRFVCVALERNSATRVKNGCTDIDKGGNRHFPPCGCGRASSRCLCARHGSRTQDICMGTVFPQCAIGCAALIRLVRRRTCHSLH
jgi:hypothetical protein